MFQDGALLAVGPLDREQQDTYVLVVTAWDGGSPQRQVRRWIHPSSQQEDTVVLDGSSCPPEHHHGQSEAP